MSIEELYKELRAKYDAEEKETQMISAFILSLFTRKSMRHQHTWESRGSTGNAQSRWEYNGNVGYGCSYLYECACGQLSVVHSGESEYVLLEPIVTFDQNVMDRRIAYRKQHDG